MSEPASRQPYFSRPSSRAISASSESRSEKGSSAFAGLTLDGLGLSTSGRASPIFCATSGGAVLAAGRAWADAGLAVTTVAACGVARGSTAAAAAAASAFSGRGGGGGAADGAGRLPEIGDGLGGTFSVRRVTVARLAGPLAGTIGGGIAGRVGAGRGEGGEPAGAGRS